MLPQEFLTRMQMQLGECFEAFSAAMLEPPAVSVKLNRRKISDVRELGYGELQPVEWCRSGYYLEERPTFTLNPLLHAGVFYVQDASSMIYEDIVRKLTDSGEISEDSAVLDLCAAPGGKTTSIINAVPDGTLVVANEFVPQRAAILKENLLKWGYPAMVVVNSPTAKLASLGEAFDLVAVDAPCSGEGMMRKDEKAVTQWSAKLVEQCAVLQREILSDAYNLLRSGGYMIYSTCTFSTLENEDNVDWLLKEFELELIESSRFMPHFTRGEGLFVAVLRKQGNKCNNMHKSKIKELLKKRTKVILDGIPRVQIKGKVEIPASERVLATDYDRSEYPEVELDEEVALRYLRHESIVLPCDSPKGYVTVTYKGHPLGLVKNIGSRANNLYPSNWRIRMELQ